MTDRDNKLLYKAARLDNIVLSSRRKGNTTWILKAAIRNPHCGIICHSKLGAEQLEGQYFKLLKKSSWVKRIWWKLFGREHPIFMSINNDLRGTNYPLIFDNSALITEI